MSNQATPWTTEALRSNRYKFTNASDQQVVMVTVTGPNGQLATTIPRAIAPGGSFEVKIPGLKTSVQISWSTTNPMRHHTWSFVRS